MTWSAFTLTLRERFSSSIAPGKSTSLVVISMISFKINLIIVSFTVCHCIVSLYKVLVSVRMFHPLATACQDVSSFVVLFVNIDVAVCPLCLSGCFILWQQPVKMYHLSSGAVCEY